MQRTLDDVSQQLDKTGETAGQLLAEEGVSERYLATLAFTCKAMADVGAPAPDPWLASLD